MQHTYNTHSDAFRKPEEPGGWWYVVALVVIVVIFICKL